MDLGPNSGQPSHFHKTGTARAGRDSHSWQQTTENWFAALTDEDSGVGGERPVTQSTPVTAGPWGRLLEVTVWQWRRFVDSLAHPQCHDCRVAHRHARAG